MTFIFIEGSWFTSTPTSPRGRTLSRISVENTNVLQTVIARHLPLSADIVSAVVSIPAGRGILTYVLNEVQTQVRF